MASELIERSLYGGLFNLVHNPNARGRQPRYVVNGTVKPKGVTTILGKVIAKDLMQWAVDCAIESLQAKLPVVTEADLREAALAYTVKRDFGAGTGTEAHLLVENYLKGRTQAASKASDEARNAYNAFKEWFENATPTVVNVEEVIYSAKHDYAGTYDCMLKINDRVYLCDLKTTNASKAAPRGVYAENFLQLGAYAAAHEEQRQHEIAANGSSDLVEIDGLMVISAKKDGKLDIVTNDELGLGVKQCGELFIHIKALYDFLLTTKKALGGR